MEERYQKNVKQKSINYVSTNTNIYHWNTDPEKEEQKQNPSSERYF
jgi:hypothetical protein